MHTATTAVTLTAPPSKSLSHRYLTGASLARGVSQVRHALDSADIARTRAVLCAAGARMRPLPDNDGWEVTGMDGGPRGSADPARPLSCDVGESGTTCRLLTAVLAAGQGFFRIHGTQRMHERPIGELTSALARLGAGPSFEQTCGCPPLLLHACGLEPALCGGKLLLGMDDSSQYFSGLLLAAPLALGRLSLELAGSKVVSWPYVGLTLQCLTDFGIDFHVETRPDAQQPWQTLPDDAWRSLASVQPDCLRVLMQPGPYRAGIHTVEGDWSGAACLLAAGAVGRSPVCVTGLRADSLQGDRALLAVLRNMGARCLITRDAVTVYPSPLRGIEIDMGDCPDLVPTVAALAAFAHGDTRIRNVAHLKIKESDRISAPAAEMRKCGVEVEEFGDGLLVRGLGPARPRLPEETVLCAHNDHRMAMSLALLGLGAGCARMQTRLDDPAVVGKSFPEFWDAWSKLS
jgi:3-phosphoshikimate 1-carboxyvinyltransferase